MWYAATAFFTALIAIGGLYYLFQKNLEREADRSLSDRLRDLQLIVRNAGGFDTQAMQDEFAEQSSRRRVVPIYYRVLNADGTLHAQSAEFLEKVDPSAFSPPTLQGVNPLIRPATGRNGLPLRVTTVLVTNPKDPTVQHLVQAAINTSWHSNLLSAYRSRLWIALACVLAASVLGGYQIARRGMAPIKEITQTARRIRSVEMDTRIDASHMPPEVESVAREFNAMLDRLKESFGRLERFSADIAHELRTPVNNIRSATEVALSRARSQEEYRDTIENISEELDRLVRIIESLLFLARSEDPKHQITKESLNLAYELQIVREFYEVAALDAGVLLAVEAPRLLEGRVDRTLFQRAVGNLVQNAIVHTQRGGHVTMRVAQENGTIDIKVQDNGCGVEARHLPHLFDRLYRVDSGRSSKLGGAGLGLAIVKSIAISHGGNVSVQSELGKGTCVTLQFPNA
jgi:two-component system heavy metal sensor histidine kinase CusS